MLIFVPPTYSKHLDWLWIHSAFYSVNTEALPQGVMGVGHEASHSSSSSVKVKYEWGYTTTPPVYCHDLHRGNLIRDIIHCQ